jgi:hypothetical protein
MGRLGHCSPGPTGTEEQAMTKGETPCILRQGENLLFTGSTDDDLTAFA